MSFQFDEQQSKSWLQRGEKVIQRKSHVISSRKPIYAIGWSLLDVFLVSD